MFKTYLKYHNWAFQLMIFLCFWFLITMICMFMVPYIYSWASGGGIMTDVESGMQHPNAMMLINLLVAQIGMFLFPCFLFAYLADERPLQYLGFTAIKNKQQVLPVIILGFAIIFIINQISYFIQLFPLGHWANSLQEERTQLEAIYFKEKTPFILIRNLLLLALTPAICEEVFFRGLLQKFIYSKTGKLFPAMLLTAIIFASFHASVYNFVPLTVAGILLSWVYFKTGSLWLSIIIHFIINGTQIMFLYFTDSGSGIEEGTSFMWIASVLSCLVAYFALKYLIKRTSPLPKDWNVQWVQNNSQQ